MAMPADGTRNGLPGSALLVALLVVEYKDVCSLLRDRGWGPMQRVPSVRGLHPPSQNALLAMAYAGLKGLAVNDPSFTRSNIERRSHDLGGKDYRAQIKGDRPLEHDLLELLAAGLGAQPDERAALLALKTAPLGVVNDESLRAAVEHVRLRRRRRLQGHELAGLTTVQQVQSTLLQRRPRWFAPIPLRELSGSLRAGEVLRPDLPARGQGLYSNGSVRLAEARPVDELLKAERVAVLLGDPGSGKSTAIAGQYLLHLEEGRGPALFARLEDVGCAAEQMGHVDLAQAAHAVVDAVETHVGRQLIDESQRTALREAVKTDPDLLLVLDGLDEISSPGRRAAAESVVSTLITGADVRVLIASRYTGYARPEGIDLEFGMSALEDGESFIHRWFQERSPAALERALQAVKSPSVQELVTNPLLVVFVCFVAETGDVPTGRAALYRRFVSLFLRQEWRDGGRRLRSTGEVASKERTTEDIAWFMCSVNGTDSRKPSRWLDILTLRQAVDGKLPPEDVEDSLRSDGLLVPHGDAPSDPLGQPFRWLHRTLHEHLVGRRLAHLMLTDPTTAEPFFRSALLRPTWFEALRFAVEELAERDAAAPAVLIIIDAWLSGDRWPRLLSNASWLVPRNIGKAGRPLIDILIKQRDWNRAVDLDEVTVRNWFETSGADLTENEWRRFLYDFSAPQHAEQLISNWIPYLERRGALWALGPGPWLIRKSRPDEVRRWAADRVIDGGESSPWYIEDMLRGADESIVGDLVARASAQLETNLGEAWRLLSAARQAEHSGLDRLIQEHFEEDSPTTTFIRFALRSSRPWSSDWSAIDGGALTRLLHDASIPEPIAQAAAARCLAAALEPIDALSPWARTGVWLRGGGDGGLVAAPRPSGDEVMAVLSGTIPQRSSPAEQIESWVRALRTALDKPSLVEPRVLLRALGATCNAEEAFLSVDLFPLKRLLAEWPAAPFQALVAAAMQGAPGAEVVGDVVHDFLQGTPDEVRLLLRTIIDGWHMNRSAMSPFDYASAGAISDPDLAEEVVDMLLTAAGDIGFAGRHRLEALQLSTEILYQVDLLQPRWNEVVALHRALEHEPRDQTAPW